MLREPRFVTMAIMVFLLASCLSLGKSEPTTSQESTRTTSAKIDIEASSTQALSESTCTQKPSATLTPTTYPSSTPEQPASTALVGPWKIYLYNIWTSGDQAPGHPFPAREGYKYAVIQLAIENISGTWAWIHTTLYGHLVDTGGYERNIWINQGPYSWGSGDPIPIPPSFRILLTGYIDMPSIYDPVIASFKLDDSPFQLSLEHLHFDLQMPFDHPSPSWPIATPPYTFEFPNDRRYILSSAGLKESPEYHVSVFATFQVDNLGGFDIKPFDPNWSTGIFLWGIDSYGHFSIGTCISGEDRGDLEEMLAPGLSANGTIALQPLMPKEKIESVWLIVGVQSGEKELQLAIFEVSDRLPE